MLKNSNWRVKLNGQSIQENVGYIILYKFPINKST